MNESPLKGDVVFGDLFSRFARLGVASAIENADRIGFELDCKRCDEEPAAEVSHE